MWNFGWQNIFVLSLDCCFVVAYKAYGVQLIYRRWHDWTHTISFRTEASRRLDVAVILRPRGSGARRRRHRPCVVTRRGHRAVERQVSGRRPTEERPHVQKRVGVQKSRVGPVVKLANLARIYPMTREQGRVAGRGQSRVMRMGRRGRFVRAVGGCGGLGQGPDFGLALSRSLALLSAGGMIHCEFDNGRFIERNGRLHSSQALHWKRPAALGAPRLRGLLSGGQARLCLDFGGALLLLCALLLGSLDIHSFQIDLLILVFVVAAVLAGLVLVVAAEDAAVPVLGAAAPGYLVLLLQASARVGEPRRHLGHGNQLLKSDALVWTHRMENCGYMFMCKYEK